MYFDTRGKNCLPGCLFHRAEPGTSTEMMLGRTKKCGSRRTVPSQWLCTSFTATGSFKEVFQESECKNQAAFAWFKCLHRAMGSLLRREECLKVSHYDNEALSPLTCSLLHLSLIPIYFLISEFEGKGWRFAFHFHGTLDTAHEILSASLSPFPWINNSLCSHAPHSVLRNIRHGTWGTLCALIWPWFLISSWIFKFCMFISHSRQETLGSLPNSPLRKCCFCGQPL